MKRDACPDLETLAKLLLGDLPASNRQSLDEHLMHCDRCTAAAETISVSDELTEAIRVRQVIRSENEVPLHVIERCKQLISTSETVRSEETLAVDTGGLAKEPADQNIDFLNPAEQPDEIGRLGNYRVLKVLGTGGMGVVFRAEDPKLRRQIALKVMKPSVAASPSSKARFLREAQATAAIEHDNIVHIYQVGEDRNVPYIAMPLLRGATLQTRLDSECYSRFGRLVLFSSSRPRTAQSSSRSEAAESRSK